MKLRCVDCLVVQAVLLDLLLHLLAGLAGQVALVEFVPQVERQVAEQAVLVLLELGQVVVELLLLLEQVGQLAVPAVLVVALHR